MKIQEEHGAFLEKLAELAEKESIRVDPNNLLEVKNITIQFTVRNSLPGTEMHCGTGCFKLSSGKCFCLSTHLK
jgi:hypothetical protein